MKVSVLVPIFNVEKYLDKCLSSLAAQTLQDMEIICINDGSTDSSKEIIQKYLSIDSRFKLIDKNNSGYGNSMNIGLAEARGEYIGIVESDDFIAPDMMESLYEKAVANQLEVVKSSCYFYSENNKGETSNYVDIFVKMPINQVFCPVDKPAIFLGLQTIWSSLYKREFLINQGIQFNNTPGASYQDVSFAFQVYACARRIMLLNDAFYYYRISNLNSSVKSPNKVFCICDELEKMDSFINAKFDGDEKHYLQVIASRLGYRVLFENFQSLSEAYQYALFVRIIGYLKNYKENGLMVGELWKENDVANVETILENPNDYFCKNAKSYKDDRVCKDNCINDQIYCEAAFNHIISAQKIVLYGAGIIGNKVLDYLLDKGVATEKIDFVVTKKENTPDKIRGLKVFELDEYSELHNNCVWVLSLKEQFQYEIADALKSRGIKDVISIDPKLRKFLESSK